MTERKHPIPGFARGLFAGHLEDGMIFPFPRADAGERESLELLLDSFRKFADQKIDGAAIDEQARMPDEVIRGLFDLGIMGMTIPEEFGGYGMSLSAYCRVMEEVSRYCASTATTIGGHQSLGYKGILLFGTQEQKREYLPKMASGDLLAAFALTEPTSGSDAASLKATAKFDRDRKVYILNGTKRWTTNGGIASLFTVFVRTPSPPGSGCRDPISAFLVPRDIPGLSSGKEEKKLGLRGSSTTDLILENVQVPAENLLGKEGRGFKIALEILNTGRLSLSACCLGAAKEMIDRSVAHARERVQFGKSISEFEMIQDKIAEMMADAFAAESVIYATSALADRDEPVDYSLESAICKIFVSEALWRVIQHAVQINGGNGFMREYPYERFLRDARVNMIFEGTNEILRQFIALAGMANRGSELKTERFGSIVAELEREAKRIETCTRELSGSVESVLRESGESIEEKEFIQTRIADAVINLYTMSCALSRANTRVRSAGKEDAAREILLCRLFCEGGWRRARRNLRQIFDNNDPDRVRAARLACSEGGYKL